MYFTTSVAVVAGACLAFAVLHLSLAVRRAGDGMRDLLFGLFATMYAVSILFARSGYLADTVDNFLLAMRASWFFGSIGFVLLIWFVGVATAVLPRRILWSITAAFAANLAVVVVAPDLLLDVSSGVTTQVLPWGEIVNVPSVTDAPLAPLILLATLSSVAYISVASAIKLRRGPRSTGVALAVGIGWFVATYIAEILVTFGVIDFVVLNDFGFLGFVLAMSLHAARTRADTEDALRRYQRNLEAMVADRTSQLRDAQAALVAQAEDRAVSAERNRIARELHDAVSQLLFSVNLMAGSLPGLLRKDPDAAERTAKEIQRLTRGALAEMRTLLRELRPVTIITTELSTLVTHLADGLAARHDIPTVVRVDLDTEVSPDVHMTVYRVAQEAINNVAKHANASHLEVELAGDDRTVYLSVADDGVGFDTNAIAGRHMGIGIMHERTSDIGADLVIASEPDVGTTVELAWRADSHG